MTAEEMTGRTQKLAVEQLYHSCKKEDLAFETTEDLAPLEDHFGQDRAAEALQFGIKMKHEGYNLFLLGSTGVGKHELLEDLFEGGAEAISPPVDWCYVNNFDSPHKPIILALPAGKGRLLRSDMLGAVEDLLVSIPAAFQSEDYQSRLQEMAEQYSQREQKAFQALGDKAREKNVALIQTPSGYTLAPLKDDKILSPTDFEALPEEEKQQTLAVIDELKAELKTIVRQLPLWAREGRENMRNLNRDFSRLVIDQLFNELGDKYRELPEVLAYLNAVRTHVSENVDTFRQAGEEGAQGRKSGAIPSKAAEFTEYAVNVLVDNSELTSAPVVYEDNPSFINLIGRVEHVAEYGTLLTNFTLIKPGAFHRANGGYLILDAAKVLSSPFAWDTLKRILRAREVRIQSLEQMFSFASTTQLEPEPIPLALKVILTGDRYLYYLLEQYDPEFGQLFKVAADMAEEISRSPESLGLFARLIKTLQIRRNLLPFHWQAVARVIEQCSRRIEDGEKISMHVGYLSDLLCESDFFARQRNGELVLVEDVTNAVAAGIYRVDQLRQKSQEYILRDIQLVDTDGESVAQVNGLAVYQLGQYGFGKPSRITATARLGSAGILDIEREARLGGKIHSKGVMIISSFLANRYARDRPFPLSATLAFEQSYGGIDGDSASVAELAALISALTDIPVDQSLAVTGSVNQHGQVQAIGGVNEKIEGFFDVCRARGLSGRQGVIIPAANVAHLMLRHDILEAVNAGQFQVYAISTVDQGLELLLKTAVGDKNAAGEFPPQSINGKVVARVEELIRLHGRYGKNSSDAAGGTEGRNSGDDNGASPEVDDHE
ncbi:MAG: AAA family ATPase [Porticoccaceae bacterium]|nr:AAA family ATPase [Porticoccaceae bacterium]